MLAFAAESSASSRVMLHKSCLTTLPVDGPGHPRHRGFVGGWWGGIGHFLLSLGPMLPVAAIDGWGKDYAVDPVLGGESTSGLSRRVIENDLTLRELY